MVKTSLKLATFALGSIFFFSCNSGSIDEELSNVINEQNLKPLENSSGTNEAEAMLGQALYFDPIVSGNKDISCATCHHPQLQTGDGLPLPIGTKGQGLGLDRIKAPDRDFIPRNAPDVFNRGNPEWHTMFWDGRVEQLPDGSFKSPAGDQLPDGLKNVLAVQALFPPTSQDEMRGKKGDIRVDGQPNELAEVDGSNFTEIWNRLMNRILSIPEYRQMFKDAYGDREYTIVDFGNAIATFEAYEFTYTNTPWDEYLRGNKRAISNEAKLGALLFYGKANCSSCHSGNLFTDQKYHNIAVPQFGPGKNEGGYDYGRYNVTGDPNDKYKFRTPPLRNVAVTFPYMHDGAYKDLKMAIKHHTNPEYYLRNYNPQENNIPDELIPTLKNSEADIQDMLSTVDIQPVHLTDLEIEYLVAFLNALTSPDLYDDSKISKSIPDSVPSGLPVDRLE